LLGPLSVGYGSKLTANSAVFASAYRFTSLLAVSPLDPSYTLAPAVGWTGIEMSAAIVSACLPTLRPALHFLLRSVGIRRGVYGSRSESQPQSSGPTKDLNTIGLSHIQKGVAGAFSRLTDENGSKPQSSIDANAHGHAYEYAISGPGHNGRGDSDSGDEIPLQGIRVKTDIEHASNAE
jgi:hypothetical protein